MQTIDLTPTWEQMLPALLMMYRQAINGDAMNPDLIKENTETELRRMAEAADRWNDYCQAQSIFSGEAEQAESARINTFLDPNRGNLPEYE